jgi:hypothetical protein
MTQEVLNEMQKKLQTWHRAALIWQTLHICLALIALASSLAVATFTIELGDFLTRVVAFAGALCLGILSSVNIGPKANNFRSAWRVLNVAICRHKANTEYSVDDLIANYKLAEEIIGDWKVDANKKKNVEFFSS